MPLSDVFTALLCSSLKNCLRIPFSTKPCLSESSIVLRISTPPTPRWPQYLLSMTMREFQEPKSAVKPLVDKQGSPCCVCLCFWEDQTDVGMGLRRAWLGSRVEVGHEGWELGWCNPGKSSSSLSWRSQEESNRTPWNQSPFLLVKPVCRWIPELLFCLRSRCHCAPIVYSLRCKSILWNNSHAPRLLFSFVKVLGLDVPLLHTVSECAGLGMPAVCFSAALGKLWHMVTLDFSQGQKAVAWKKIT